jgi:hypothetical protein
MTYQLQQGHYTVRLNRLDDLGHRTLRRQAKAVPLIPPRLTPWQYLTQGAAT